MTPLNGNIIVRRDEPETRTPGGIVLPEQATTKPTKGVVVHVGPGKLRDDGTYAPSQVAAGQKVLFPTYGPTEIDVDGETLLIIRESDILAVL